MTQIQPRHIRIYKNILAILGAFVICGSTLLHANAAEFASVQYNKGIFIDYNQMDKAKIQNDADSLLEQALKSEDLQTKKDLFQKAAGQYYILTRLEPNNIQAVTNLARVYDYENKNTYAKAYFYKALEIDKNDINTNYYFGNFYYSRNQYQKALKYYKLALKNGYPQSHDLMSKMAGLYEKLGDLQKASQCYKKAFLENRKDSDIANKIIELENLKTKNARYYTKQRKK